MQKYSTEEIIIGEWLGKPLYRKVIILNDSVNSNFENRFPHNIENADLIMIKDAFVKANDVCVPLPITLYGNNKDFDYLSITADKNDIIFRCQTGWGTTWQKIIILEYTKTTD